MPIDASQVKWDAIDPNAVQWDAPAEKPSFMQSMGREALNSIPVQTALGALRGAAGIGNTLLPGNRKAGIEGGMQALGGNPDSMSYGAGKLGAEIAGTAGMGGLAAKGLSAIPGVAQAAPSLINALRTSGMTTGAAPANFLSKAGLADMAIRTGAGAAVGGASAAAVGDNPLMGAAIGGATPGVFKAAGMAGEALGSVFTKVKNAVTGSKADAGNSLLSVLGNMSKEEVKALADAAAKAPDEILPGSKLTFAQALELVGKQNPSIQHLERVVSQGPGGAALSKRYADQTAARFRALEQQGAQSYQGAAKEEMNQAGNMLGARLRTQYADESLLNQGQWEALKKQATQEGTALQYPIDSVEKALAQRFPPGSAITPKEANSVLSVMRSIGMDELPAVTASKAPRLEKSLEQAVRAEGGLRAKGDVLSGEIQSLKESGKRGLVTKKGKSSDMMVEALQQRGFNIKGEDPDALINALSGGKAIYPEGALGDDYFRAMAERNMPDLPAERIPKAVPFNSFQATRRDAGIHGRNVVEKDPNHAGLLGDIEKLMAGRVDDAASGNLLSGESMSPGFRDAYVSARDATKGFHDRYGAGNLDAILKKQYGGTYNLNGDEIFNKVWHGGSGLQQDVANVKNALTLDNQGPVLDKLREAVMTDARAKTTAGGDFGAALPSYVENRMPGLRELLTPDQYSAITNTAKDIRNAAGAQSVSGASGSSTYSNISNALDAGVFDGSTAKALARLLSFKTFGVGESARKGLAEAAIKNKGSALAELLAEPKLLQKALNDATPAAKSKLRELLSSPEAQQLMYRMAPISQ